jgi:phage-related protein (TIGR01555 family)
LTANGTNNISKRVQHANILKNFQNSITMDMDDEYQQKQVSFAGLSDILTQIRQGIAAALKMPMTKLFGISSAGFNSGEDDIENYNSMVEGEIRAKCKFHVVDLLQICCQIKFGMVPTDIMIKFKPLRVLSAEQEENVKDKQFLRTTNAFNLGLATDVETKQAINKNGLLPVEIDESESDFTPNDYNVDDAQG